MIDGDNLNPAGWRNTFYEDVPGMVDIWQEEKSTHRPDFVEYIDSTILNR